jgi:hypothetical protein
VRVDIADLARVHARAGQRALYAQRDPAAVGQRVGQVVGVGGEGAANKLRQDRRAAAPSVLQLLQHHHAWRGRTRADQVFLFLSLAFL